MAVSKRVDTHKDVMTPPGAPPTAHSSPKGLSYFESLLSDNPRKRAAELFLWKWHLAWIGWFAGIVVLKTYENFDKWSYLKTGLLVGIPPIILPLFFPRLSGEEGIPWHERYTTKINIFILIASWIGNYFWTHYFYKVLGTVYTFPSHTFNDVPIACYLLTHSYFLFYHSAASIAFRALWRRIAHRSYNERVIISTVVSVLMGYFTAVLEVATIASFPYYSYPDSYRMWVIGSGFYGVYFLISFPYITWLDEVAHIDRTTERTPFQVAIDGFAYGMVTTMMLDLWRLIFGNLNPGAVGGIIELASSSSSTATAAVATASGSGVPFIY